MHGYLVVEIENENGVIIPEIEFLKESKVIFYERSSNGTCEEIVYLTDNAEIAAYINDEMYCLINLTKKEIIQDSIVIHKLGIT